MIKFLEGLMLVLLGILILGFLVMIFVIDFWMGIFGIFLLVVVAIFVREENSYGRNQNNKS